MLEGMKTMLAPECRLEQIGVIWQAVLTIVN